MDVTEVMDLRKNTLINKIRLFNKKILLMKKLNMSDKKILQIANYILL